MKKLMYIAGAAVAAMAAMAAVPNEAAAAVVTGGFTFVPNGQPTFNNGASTNIVAGITHKPGFPRWIGPTGPKAAETLAKLPIPSFTRRVRQDSTT